MYEPLGASSAIYQSNTWKLSLHAFFHTFRIYLPLYYIFLRDNGLDFTEITILASAYYAGAFLLELPSGVFSDKFGRKASIILSSVFSLASYAFFIFGTGFIPFFIASALIGICESFISGSDEAIIYDSLKAAGKEKDFTKHYGRKHAFLNYGYGIGSLFASIIIVTDIRYLFILSAAFECFALITALTLTEPPVTRTSGNYVIHLKDAARFAKNNPPILWLIIFFASITSAVQIFFRFMQFIILDAGIEKIYFGYLYAYFIVFCGFVSMVAHRFEKSLNMRISFTYIIVLLTSALAGIGLSSASTSLFPIFIFICAIEFVFGFYAPVINHAYHDLTESHHRATVASLKSFAGGLSIAIFAPLFGKIADASTYNKSVFMMGIIFLAVSLICLKNLLATNTFTEKTAFV